MGDIQAAPSTHFQNKTILLSFGIHLLLEQLKSLAFLLSNSNQIPQWGHNSIFILIYETLMVYQPCSKIDSSLRAYIWQVALKHHMGLTSPSFSARCLYPQPTVTSKTEHLSPEMTHLLSVSFLFTGLMGTPLHSGWVTTESQYCLLLSPFTDKSTVSLFPLSHKSNDKSN